MPFLVILIAIIILIALLVTYWYIAVVLIAIWAAVRVIRHIRMKRYFASEAFQDRVRHISSVVAEHNAIEQYVREISASGLFRIGASATGEHASLATFENTSKHHYRRDRNAVSYRPNVHNCSLQVVRNASANPLQYVIKYFGIKTTPEGLAEVEKLGESISRLENAVSNLKEREAGITTSFAPPPFILKHYSDEFMNHVGVRLSPIKVPYPEYVFEYVSAGGNSSQKATVRLDTPTIDRLMEVVAEKVRFRKSAAGQRALMTARFRDYIKQRDRYTCRYCSVALADEPHLLLEVDHITPVSRGGLSVEENLQTLCWRCNRAKSNKIAITR